MITAKADIRSGTHPYPAQIARQPDRDPSPRRRDSVGCFPAHPKRAATVADGKITTSLGLKFALHRIRARIDLYDSPASRADPDKAPADSDSGPSNRACFKSGELLTALGVDPLDSAVTFIKDPDRPLSSREGGWSRPKFNSRRNLVGRWINAVQFVVSGSRDPDETKGDKDP